MLISTKVNVSWNAKTKNHYVNAGYKFTKMGDRFQVLVNDLTTGCNELVAVKCDYCEAVFYIEYYRYLIGHSEEVEKDCCNKCKKIKIRETLYKKYGVFTPGDIDGARNKAKETNLRKYGVENPFEADWAKQKAMATNEKKYGVPYANQSSIVQDKRKQTCMERYGFDSHMKAERYRKMFSGSNSPKWKADKDHLARERDRSCPEYRKWRDEVFHRDFYKCQCCGGRGDSKHGLEAHHIFNYSSDIARRFDKNNGVTLCYFCHKQFHSIYGKTNNNQSQLTEFLSQGKKIC